MIEIPKKEPLNIVPFIDIMLVLLAMVLSISTFIAKGEIQINLPKSKTADVPKEAPEQRIVRWMPWAIFSSTVKSSLLKNWLRR